MKLEVFDEQLSPLESGSFPDVYTLNFHLQTLSKKYKLARVLLVVHDADLNTVNLAVAKDEDSLFVD